MTRCARQSTGTLLNRPNSPHARGTLAALLVFFAAGTWPILAAAPADRPEPSHDVKSGDTDDGTSDEGGIAIARLSWPMKSMATRTDEEFENALAHTKAEQQSAARMAAVLDGEASVFDAEKLGGQKKIDWLEQAARTGDAAAAAELGDRLDLGNGLREDRGRAFGYFLAGALGGRMEAAHNLGAAYATGRGVRRDFTEALAWLIVAHARGDPSGADGRLRRHLLERRRTDVVAAGERRARELGPRASRAAIVAALPPAAPLTFVAEPAEEPTVEANDFGPGKTGAASAAPEIVVMTMTGKRLTWPTLADLQRAANRDDRVALDALGHLLVAGKWLPADPLRAVVLFERSAALGNVDAAHQLGDLYSDGENLVHDDAKAFAYYLKAAQGGSLLAMANVGVYLTNGRGTEHDYVKGLAWLTVAKHYGVDRGQEGRLRVFLAQHDPGDVAKADAMAAGLIREIEPRLR